MAGAGLGQGNVQVAPGAGEVPGHRIVRSASTAFCQHLDFLRRRARGQFVERAFRRLEHGWQKQRAHLN